MNLREKNMDVPNASGKWKMLCLFTVIYAVISVLFYWTVAEDWSRSSVETEMVSPSGIIPGNGDAGMNIQQSFVSEVQELMSLRVRPGKVRAEVTGVVLFRILEEDRTLWEKEMDAASLSFDTINEIQISPVIQDVRGHELLLEIDASDTGVSFYQGTTVSAGKFDIPYQGAGTLIVNGKAEDGYLVLGTYGENQLSAYRWIIPGEVALYFVILALFAMVEHQRRTGKQNLVGKAVQLANQYSYLLKTLVVRDFRIKYQSSVLGALWSFLNPLLTMFVYLFVFSMLFQSNVEHFPVYLLSGIIMFNYFSESTSLGLLSIVGNRTLITKVYMPKYIYPLSKVLSAAVNLVISFVPLFIVVLVTGLPIHRSILLLPLVLLFQIMFCTGMALILSTLNVFFRDIQFLWGILVTIWNFLTPVFYPESIIPQAFIRFYHLNPLYQIIYFTRCILIGGVSPAPITYLYCLVLCGIPLVVGVIFFKKNQDRFVLYL